MDTADWDQAMHAVTPPCEPEDSAPTSLSHATVVVEVGSPPTEFSVQETLLVAHSGFFKGALSGHFQESNTRKIPLHEDDPDTFRRVVAWIQTGIIDSVVPAAATSTGGAAAQEEDADAAAGCADEDASTTAATASVGKLFELWILGDKLQVPALQNAVAQELIEMVTRDDSPCACTQLPTVETLERVYDNTIDTSPLRRLAIDMAVLTGAAHGLAASLGALAPDILVDLASRALTFWGQETSTHVAKRTHLRGAHVYYSVAAPPPPPGAALALAPCPHIGSRDTCNRSCLHQSVQHAQHRLSACRNVRLERSGATCRLVAECEAGPGTWLESALDLNTMITNTDGRLRWVRVGQTGNFSWTARGLELEDGGEVLVGEVQRVNQTWRRRRIVLSEKIFSLWGELKYIS